MEVFVLDTNVLLTDVQSIYHFPGKTIIIPCVVIQELDSKKRLHDDLGQNARQFSRMMDNLCQLGSLSDGVELENGSTLLVCESPKTSRVYDVFDDMSKDTMILALCDDYRLKQVTLVSKDILVRIKANIISIPAVDYLADKVIQASDDRYKGFTELFVDDELINQFYANKQLEFSCNDQNHFYLLRSWDQRKSAIAIFKKNKLYPLYHLPNECWGIQPKNVEQKMALELLLDTSIPLVTLSGKAGTGKTLLALAAALTQVMDDHTYTKLLVARPVVPMGKDIGYLPGDMNEKLAPWMQPIYDNLEFLFNCKSRDDLDKILLGMQKQIQVEALTYIRGRSIPGQFIIIDEAQNLTRHEVKTILTRVGEQSKIILIGDPDQIDHPYLDSFNNGLTYAIETLKSYDQTGHITLQRGERSSLAQLCADCL